MKRYRFLLPLIIVYCSCATAAEQSDKIGRAKLPDKAVLLCGQHVVGDANGNATHIDWQAFGLKEDIDKIAQFYQTQFGQTPVLDDTGRYTWRFKRAYSELVYSLQSSLSAGPWSGCSLQSSEFKNIVLISNSTSGKEP